MYLNGVEGDGDWLVGESVAHGVLAGEEVRRHRLDHVGLQLGRDGRAAAGRPWPAGAGGGRARRVDALADVVDHALDRDELLHLGHLGGLFGGTAERDRLTLDMKIKYILGNTLLTSFNK